MRLNESILNRRDFLDGLLGAGVVTWGCIAGEMALAYLTGREIPVPDEIEVGKESLAKLERDRYVILPYGPLMVMLYRLPDGELRALSAICTHGACNVKYRPEENDIFCACHEGLYTADGINVPGSRPPEPLKKYHFLEREDGTLLVSNQPFDGRDQDDPAQDTPLSSAEG